MTDTKILIAADPMAGKGLPPLTEARSHLLDCGLGNLTGLRLLLPTRLVPGHLRGLHTSVMVRGMLDEYLPGWWFRLGQCHLSTDIALGPDYNDPAHGARLRREFPESFWDGGLDFDIRPPVSDAAGLAFGLLAALQRIVDLQDAVKQGRLTWPE